MNREKLKERQELVKKRIDTQHQAYRQIVFLGSAILLVDAISTALISVNAVVLFAHAMATLMIFVVFKERFEFHWMINKGIPIYVWGPENEHVDEWVFDTVDRRDFYILDDDGRTLSKNQTYKVDSSKGRVYVFRNAETATIARLMVV